MCEKTVEKEPYALEYIPDWFVIPKLLEDLDDDKDLNSDEEFDEVIKCCNGYKQRKAQKVKMKEELLPIARHSSSIMGLMHGNAYLEKARVSM